MKKVVLLLAVVTALLMSGCASKAEMAHMVYNPAGKHLVYDNMLEHQVNLSEVSGGSETYAGWKSNVGDAEFKGALKQSLINEGLFSQNGRYVLSAVIEDVDQPIVGISMTVTMHTKYTLTDTQSKKVLLTKILVTPYTAAFSDAFLGVERLRLANEGSGQENIKAILAELAKLKIDKTEVSLR